MATDLNRDEEVAVKIIRDVRRSKVCFDESNDSRYMENAKIEAKILAPHAICFDSSLRPP